MSAQLAAWVPLFRGLSRAHRELRVHSPFLPMSHVAKPDQAAGCGLRDGWAKGRVWETEAA